MATVRPEMIQMPDMPGDLSIQQYVEPDDCQSVKIGWLSANSLTDLKYCVYVQENSNSLESVDFSVKPDQCKVRYGKSRRSDFSNNYRTKTRCYIGEKGYTNFIIIIYYLEDSFILILFFFSSLE